MTLIALLRGGKLLWRARKNLTVRFSAEGETSWPTGFERAVPASQAVDNTGGHSHHLLELIVLIKEDGNTLLHGNDVDQHQYWKACAVATRNMDTVTGRVVHPQYARIPLDELKEQNFVVDPPSDLVLQ